MDSSNQVFIISCLKTANEIYSEGIISKFDLFLYTIPGYLAIIVLCPKYLIKDGFCMAMVLTEIIDPVCTASRAAYVSLKLNDEFFFFFFFYDIDERRRYTKKVHSLKALVGPSIMKRRIRGDLWAG